MMNKRSKRQTKSSSRICSSSSKQVKVVSVITLGFSSSMGCSSCVLRSPHIFQYGTQQHTQNVLCIAVEEQQFTQTTSTIVVGVVTATSKRAV
jgi:hypothetical protein